MPYDLERFVNALAGAYADVLAELGAGRKTSHWIWFVFPQLRGLGRSDMSRFYAIESVDEARAYLAHAVLGPRLLVCSRLLLAVPGRSADEILGPIDAVKVRSCVTLFQRAAPDEPVFREVLDRFYDGLPDEVTLALLA
jgi:uncharacterized protein (DUF1810 family)